MGPPFDAANAASTVKEERKAAGFLSSSISPCIRSISVTTCRKTPAGHRPKFRMGCSSHRQRSSLRQRTPIFGSSGVSLLQFLRVPQPDDVHDPVNWRRTAFHELGHWTSRGSWLDRDQAGRVGSKDYGSEELYTEMAGAFSCAALSIVPRVRHADYIGSWLSIICEDAHACFRFATGEREVAAMWTYYSAIDFAPRNGYDTRSGNFSIRPIP